MASLNKTMLIGNLGRDPDITQTATGSKVAYFSIATDESYTPKGGSKVKKTEWHKIVCWRSLAEIVERYLRKGSQVYIEGKLQTRKWMDQNGVEHNTTEIKASQMQMLGGKRDEVAIPFAEQVDEVQPAQEEDEGNLPF